MMLKHTDEAGLCNLVSFVAKKVDLVHFSPHKCRAFCLLCTYFTDLRHNNELYEPFQTKLKIKHKRKTEILKSAI